MEKAVNLNVEKLILFLLVVLSGSYLFYRLRKQAVNPGCEKGCCDTGKKNDAN